MIPMWGEVFVAKKVQTGWKLALSLLRSHFVYIVKFSASFGTNPFLTCWMAIVRIQATSAPNGRRDVKNIYKPRLEKRCQPFSKPHPSPCQAPLFLSKPLQGHPQTIVRLSYIAERHQFKIILSQIIVPVFLLNGQ